MYISLNRGTTGGNLSLEQFVQLAADAGFGGADVDLAYGEQHGVSALRDLYAAKNLRFGGWGPPVDWRGEESKLKDGLAALDKRARIARELNIDSCATYLLPSNDLPFHENWTFHVKRLSLVAKVLAEHGLRFGLEFVAPYHLRRRWKHEFVFSIGQVLELAAEVGDNVGLLVDCFHVHTAGDTWEYLASLPASKIVLAHLNDAPKVPVAAVLDGERLLPGDGAIDIKAFWNALAKTGYQGSVSLEVFNAELKAMTPEAAAKKAWQACAKTLGLK